MVWLCNGAEEACKGFGVPGGMVCVELIMNS